MKHLKTLGLATLAVVALVAMVGDSSAIAAQFHATAETNLTGNQTTALVYEVTGQKVACNVATFIGTAAASGTSTTQSMHPDFAGCTAFELSGNINTAGCQFNLTALSSTMNLSGCTNGIEIDSSSPFSHCHANIKNQNVINGVSFANMGSTAEGNATMTITFASTNIDATVNVDNGFCPLTIGSHTASNLNGVIGVMGATGGTHIT